MRRLVEHREMARTTEPAFLERPHGQSFPLRLSGDERRRLLNLARELQHGIEPFPASHGDIYRVRAMDVNTQVDNFDAMIAGHGSGLLAKI